jgi:ATP-dependent Clp protease ATP-binding subunit ClpB
MTSNLGAQSIVEPKRLGFADNGKSDASDEERTAAAVKDALKSTFRPEFLNRLDEIIFYKPLTRDEIMHIADLMIDDLQKRLDDKHITLKVSQEVKEYIVDCGYDPSFGARPMRRFIQRKLETLIAKKLIESNLSAGDVIDIRLENGELSAD